MFMFAKKIAMIKYISFLPVLLPIVLLILVAVVSKKGNIIFNIGKLVLGASVASAIIALICLNSINQVQTLDFGPKAVSILFRLDSLSVTMFFMVAFIGLIVLNFSKNYVKGEPNEITFIRRLICTTALAQLLVISGSLPILFIMWVTTSISLQFLIAFYKDRKGAQRAVRKKFIVARMSDALLLTGLLFLYFEFKSGDIEVIFQRLKSIPSNHFSINLELSALFLAAAAIIKSVQIPFHGWILDVMEAPTPVSALLHAGLLNAGPYLIIRFAYLMDVTSFGSILLLIVGGSSALYGTLVFPTQASVKTSLAYSSIGHMGFSLMICGMGLYSAALLHLIAHSFYKAHSFLSSGSAIDIHRLNQLRGGFNLEVKTRNAITGFLIIGILYFTLMQFMGGTAAHNFQFLILGAIIIIGVSSYQMKLTRFKNGFVIMKSIFISGLVMLLFFMFERLINALVTQEIPSVGAPNSITKAVSILLLFLYLLSILLPLFRNISSLQITEKWRVYRKHGFYVHILFDRFLEQLFLKHQIRLNKK